MDENPIVVGVGGGGGAEHVLYTTLLHDLISHYCTVPHTKLWELTICEANAFEVTRIYCPPMRIERVVCLIDYLHKCYSLFVGVHSFGSRWNERPRHLALWVWHPKIAHFSLPGILIIVDIESSYQMLTAANMLVGCRVPCEASCTLAHSGLVSDVISPVN